MGRHGIWWEDAMPLIEEIKKHSEIKHLRSTDSFCPTARIFLLLKNKEPAFYRFSENTEIHRQNQDFLFTRIIPPHFGHLTETQFSTQFESVFLQFGVSPPQGSILADLPVEPVLSFHAKLAMIKNLPEGTTLSYGRQYTLQRDSKIGIISAGYGDAIPLPCGNRAYGLIDGRILPLSGESNNGSDLD